MSFLEEAQAIKGETIAIRRDLHRHPELGLEEERTAGIVAKKLQELGLSVTMGIGKTGVVGLLRGQAESPVLLLRFDMDALPIQEETGVEYASEVPGKMHACGHDSHVAVGLSVAKLLAQHKAELNGTIKFVFQPGEEGAGGAKMMVDDGVLENPKVDYSMAMHVWNEKPIGWYELTKGPVMAGAEIFSVKITGKGGHAASPHQSADPIAASAQIITALQTIVSRNVPPLESAVVSVCQVYAGTAFNIIPQEAHLNGTIRAFTPEILGTIHERFTGIVNGITSAMGCGAEVTFKKITLPVANNPALVELMTNIVMELDPDAKIDHAYQTMGSEDFSFLMQDIPGLFLMVGSANPDKGLTHYHHHPKFNIDEACLPYAAAILARGALAILERGSTKP